MKPAAAESVTRRLIAPLGESSLAFFSYLGGSSLLLWQILIGFGALPWGRWVVNLALPWRWKVLRNDRKWQLVLDQMEKVGVASFPLVFLTSLFTGMVLALQTAYQLQKISAQLYIGALVALSMTRELGPVLTALVIAGRVGAAITAELGTMRVTEQIDALHTLSTDPLRYLAVPRIVALGVMLPMLTFYADLIGILGGYLVGVYKLGIGSSLYMNMTWNSLRFKDFFTGLFKAVVFAAIISTIACYEGFETEGGAEGVGRSTTLSVVISFILIIAADCFFTALFYFVFP
ncbi:MAG: ABC transporter permease [Candidatus Omnitrophica bacterium]|nr:ABC transporter permease [Candidatus Omnitrophota bacterium]